MSNKKSYHVVVCMLIWMEVNISKELSVGSISLRSGYSQWHFQKLFYKVTGYSIAKYIRLRRMTIAAELLKSTKAEIANICFSVGFNDHRSFCRCFHNHFGVTPSRYRNGDDTFPEKMIYPPDIMH